MNRVSTFVSIPEDSYIDSQDLWVCIQRKYFLTVKRGPEVVDQEKLRFDIFVLLVEEWLRRKLRVKSSRASAVNEWWRNF